MTNKLRVFIFLCLSLAMVIPLIMYFFIFHHGLSKSSQDWGAFGSFIGGIYAPVAAIISVYVLVVTLKEMQLNNKKTYEFQNHTKRLDDLKWLAELLRNTLNNNASYNVGREIFYKSLTLKLQNITSELNSVNESNVKDAAIGLMRDNEGLFKNEIFIFEELFYRVTHFEDDDGYSLAVMLVLGTISPEERFWLMQYAKSFNSSAAKWLKEWPGFDEIPFSMTNILRTN